MSEILRDSSYEQCAAVNKITQDEAHPDYVELSNSTYDKIPDHHFNGQNSAKLNGSQHEYTTPLDFRDYSLKDSLEYEKPIHVVRPLSQLQPQRQQNYYVPELPRNHSQDIHGKSLPHLQERNRIHDTTQRHQLETKVPNNQNFSKISKRPCIVAVLVLTIIIIASGVAAFLVFHFKEQDKSNTDGQQQDTTGESTSTIPPMSIRTSTTMTTKTAFVSSSVIASTLAQTMAPTTVAKTEVVTASTAPTTVVPTTFITTTLSPTTKTVEQTANPSSAASPTGMFKDCKDLKSNGYSNNGVYSIYPYLPVTTSVRVYCDMTTDGGGWTVFQHRRDGSVNFYLLWDNYKKGFGEPNGEYWLGNDHLHQLTSLGTSDFYVRLEKFTGGWAYAKYNNFTVADESDGYRMRLRVGSYRGNAGDSIESHGTTNTNGYKFSTSDVDNDFAPASCAFARQGAWWHNICTWANLNGIYGNGSCIVSGNCNFWYSLTNSYSGVRTSFMMVRRVL